MSLPENQRVPQAALPLLLILLGLVWGVETWFDRQIEERHSARLEHQSALVRELATRTEPSAFIRSRFLPILRGWGKGGAPSPRSLRSRSLPRLGEAVGTRWGISPAWYCFDPRGRMTQVFPRAAPNRRLMGRLFGILAGGPRLDDSPAGRQVARQVGFLFGAEKTLAFLRSERGRLIDLTFGEENGFLAWENGPAGGIIIHAPQGTTPAEVFRRVLGSRSWPFLGVGFGSLEAGSLTDAAGAPDPAAERARQELQGRGTFAGPVGGLHWVFQETISGRVVYASFPLPAPDPFPVRQILRVVAAGFACLLVLGALSARDLLVGVSLRMLLLFLFAGAGLVPFAGLVGNALDLVQLSGQSMGEKVAAAQNHALVNVIREFDGYLGRRSRDLATLVNTLPAREGIPDGALLMQGLRRFGLVGDVGLRDAAGNLLYGFGPRLSIDQEALYRSLARRAVELQAPALARSISYHGNEVTDRAVATDEMGFNDILSHPGELQVIQTGKERILVFFQVLPRPIGRMAFAEIRIPLERAVRDYLRSRTRLVGAFQDMGLRVAAFDVRRFRWVTPVPAGLEGAFQRLAQRGWMTGLVQVGRFRWRGRGGIAAALFSPRLADHCLTAWCSDDSLRRRQAEARSGLILGIVGFVGLLLLLGQALSIHLVAPLQHLENGVTALRDRRFEFRVRVQRDDELGGLFAAFDEMMNNSQDLQVARRVQEGLISRGFPTVPGYSLAGRVEMATDLGGDILHCLPLPDGRVAFLVGDISGHGIGSALLMAFARAVAFHWSERSCPTPADLAADLDQALRGRRGSKAFLGAVCGVLDPRSHLVSLTVQGHVYPLHLRRHGPSAWIGKPAYPLGVASRTRPFPMETLALEPGDALLCVTDGFIEARNALGQQVGYDRVAVWAAKAREPLSPRSLGERGWGEGTARRSVESARNPAAIWLSALVDAHFAWAGPVREDDVTLFALIREEPPA